MFQKNNPAIALNELYIKAEGIYQAYISKHNTKRKKQMFF